MVKKVWAFANNIAVSALYILPAMVTLFGIGVLALLLSDNYTDRNVTILAAALISLLIVNLRSISAHILNFVPKSKGLVFMLILGVVVWTGWNLNYTAQHVFSDRDPATYLLTAAYMQDSSNVTFDVPDVVKNIEFTTVESPGFTYLNEDQDKISAQGMHLFPALASVAGKTLGELRMSSINVVFAAFALLAFFGFSRLFIGEKWALIACAVLALSLPFLYFSRDFYSEILTIMILFSTLSLLAIAHKNKRYVWWFLAGMSLGALALVRIDGFLSIAAVFFILLFHIAEADGKKDRAKARWLVLTTMFATSITAGLGIIDLFAYTPSYYANENRASLMLYQFILLCSSLIFGLSSILLSHSPKIKKAFKSVQLRRILLILFSLILIVIITRPLWLKTYTTRENKFVATIQDSTGHKVDPNRTYNEYSVEWVSWYVGTPIVYAGIFIAVWLFVSSLKDTKRKLPLIVFCGVLLTNAIVYFVRPSISPDQIWAVRRFLPVVIPSLILCSVYALSHLEKQLPQPVRSRSFFVVTSVLIIMPGLITSSPFFTTAEYQRMKGFSLVCRNIPDNAVVLWLSQAGKELVMATNIYCDVPSFAMQQEHPDRKMLSSIRKEISSRGKELYIGYYDSFYGNLDKDIMMTKAETVSNYSYLELERRIFVPPKEANVKKQKIFLGRVAENGTITSL